MASSSNGWIKLHRQMLDWEWYTDLPVKVLYVHLLLRANHAPGAWRGIPIDRGELVTSVPHLSEETGLSIQQVKTALKKLEKTGEITRKATAKKTLIKCCNYTVYQASENEEQPDNNRIVTADQPHNNRSVTTNKKNKKYKNNKKNNQLHREPSFDIQKIMHDAYFNEDYDI